jgi:hypothetical protein
VIEMTRWTIRNVSDEATCSVHRIQQQTGATDGEVISACIRLGAEAAAREVTVRTDWQTELLRLLPEIRAIVADIERLLLSGPSMAA